MIKFLQKHHLLIMRLSDILFWISLGLILGTIYGVYFTVDYVNMHCTGLCSD